MPANFVYTIALFFNQLKYIFKLVFKIIDINAKKVCIRNCKQCLQATQNKPPHRNRIIHFDCHIEDIRIHPHSHTRCLCSDCTSGLLNWAARIQVVAPVLKYQVHALHLYLFWRAFSTGESQSLN